MDIIEKALGEGRKTLSEHESKELLRRYDIPVTREVETSDEKEALKAVNEIGFPLVIKACAPDLSHKTERGLVRVDIRNKDEAVSAIREILKEVKDDNATILIQEMVKGTRELVVGLVRDSQFGPCVMFGLGGIFTEILRDVSFRVAPIEKRDAMEMMQEIKARKILEAIRGMPAADLDRLSDILIKMGNIGLEHDSIKEIDINPLILSGSQPVAVDALVVLSP
ncbi:MAG: acetate--CoA ligase family protein [Pseudomonadota bacterium]